MTLPPGGRQPPSTTNWWTPSSRAACHLIVTLRTKTGYEIAQDERQESEGQKLGLAFVQREGLEYEFTVVLDLSIDGHTATSTKDRTRLFDGKYFTPTEETGKRLFAWLNSGTDPKGELVQQIERLIRQLNLGDLQPA